MERALTFRPAPGAEAKARPRGQSNDHKTAHVWFLRTTGNVPPFICRSERGPRAAAGRHRHMMLTMTASREPSGIRPTPAGTPRGPLCGNGAPVSLGLRYLP
jgi:hypothetical protein